MPDLTTHTIDVPGARLYWERRGTGPTLLMIGSPMDSGGFAALADALADRYTVVTYDPRGIGHSTRADTGADVAPEQQADDVHRLLAALGGGPVDVFGSSGGATVGLALVAAHPDAVRTLVAHEPPVIEMLPDRDRVVAEIEEVYEAYRADGAEKAMALFMTHTGLGAGPAEESGAPAWQPTPEQVAAMRATTETFLAHLLLPTTRYRPDVDALRAAATRVVVAGGDASSGQLAYRAAQALAGRLGTDLVHFPGGHGGFMEQTRRFADILDGVLREP